MRCAGSRQEIGCCTSGLFCGGTEIRPLGYVVSAFFITESPGIRQQFWRFCTLPSAMRMATAVAKSARRLTNAVRVGVIVKVGNNPTVAGAIDATELAADCQTRAARKGFIYRDCAGFNDSMNAVFFSGLCTVGPCGYVVSVIGEVRAMRGVFPAVVIILLLLSMGHAIRNLLGCVVLCMVFGPLI